MDFKWTDRVDGVDPASANDINTVAHAVEALNEEIKSLTSGGGGGGGGSGTDIKVPTKTSELENDSGFITGNDVPKKLSELENDVGYLKENSDSGAFINYGEGYAVNIGASADVSIASGGNVYLNGRNGTVVSAEEGEIAADFSNQRIANIADPKADTDGANKKYVDDAVKGIDIPDVSVPTKVSQLENDAGYITKFADEIFVDEMNVTGTLHTQSIYGHDGIDISSEHTSIGSIDGAGIDFGGYNTDRNYGQIEGDMRVQTPVNDASVANKGYVDGEITVHNTSTTAHNDIRLLISGLTSRLDAVANSDDTTLDQLSEIVAYIKANKSLIDSITTSKVNVSDIIDNLTTSVSTKPLSAKMGVELKKLIDAITIPTTLPASDVYSWAKQPTKPTYTAAEVGAATPAYVDEHLGETIESVKQTTTSTEDGGTNVMTVTLSDGTKSTFSVKNGSKGSKGDKGDTYTLTESDKAEIINAIIDYFGAIPIVGMVDEDNSIVLNGSLPNGDYSLRYEGANGAYSDVVTLTITDEDKVSYINVLPLAQEYASTSPYVGTDGSAGYGNGMRISTSSSATTYMKVQTGVDVTALIPVKRGDVLRFKNCNFKVAPSNTSYGTFIQGFNSAKAVISGFNIISTTIEKRIPYVTDGDEIVEITLEPKSEWTGSNIDDVAYIMIATDGLDETSIITINQEIID